MMQSILVTGANGFIGQHIIKQLLEKRTYKIIASGKNISRLPFDVSDILEYVPFDITNRDEVLTAIQVHRPDIVIHAAAISQTDHCELHKNECDLVNIDATAFITEACAEMNAYLFFLSSDFVFSGDNGPYCEENERSPVNHYGWSKMRGEEILEQSGTSYCIGRLCFVYGLPVGASGNGLITKVIDLLKKGEIFKVVTDQVRTPTWVEDAVSAIIMLCEQRKTGIYHISGDEIMTPYDMAYRTAEYLKLDTDLLVKVDRSSFVQHAQRPLNSGLLIDKIRLEIGFSPLKFEEALRVMFTSAPAH